MVFVEKEKSKNTYQNVSWSCRKDRLLPTINSDSGAGDDEDSFFKIENLSGVSDMLDVHASADAE